MRAVSSILTAGLVILLAATANAMLIDNFDSYADNAALMTAWTANVGAGLALNTSESVSAPNSVKNPGTLGASMRQHMSAIPASALDFSFDFYDYDGGYDRDYGMMYARTGDQWSGGLNNLMAVGKNNNILTNRYFARVAFGTTTSVYGDGATAPVSGGWFGLGGGPSRSVGWHTAQVTGEPDPLNPGQVVYKFYIDGTLGGSVSNQADVEYNWVVMGSGLAPTVNPLAFDNVMAVPEPSALALGMVGLAGASFLRRRRR